MTPQIPATRAHREKQPLRTVAVILLASSSYLPLHLPQANAQITAAPSPSFEVASIKPDHSGTGNMSMGWRNSTFTAENAAVMQLLEDAFHVHNYQVVNAPKWVIDTHYDVVAKADDTAQALSPEVQQKQIRLMLQALLSERCKLRFHRETKNLPVYELVPAKSGPKLHEASAGENFGANSSDTQLKATAITMEQMAEQLSGQFNRTVLDKTGLTGKYDFTVNYAPDQDQAAPGYGQNAAQPDAGPSIFTAVQDQLGLKLVAAKGPVEVIIIDSIEPPSPN